MRDLVAGPDVILEEVHGTYLLKGIDGDWQLLAVTALTAMVPSVTSGSSRQPSWRCTGTRRYAVSDRCAAEHATMVKGNRPANVLGRRAIQLVGLGPDTPHP